MPGKPLLLVDIDGVLSLFGFELDERPAGTWQLVDGIPHYLSAEAGRHLLDLAADFELVWCSGWEEKGNDYLPRAYGLPAPLPFLSFDTTPSATHCHWKLEAIDAFAGQRPLAWIDDGIDDACHEWAAARTAPTLLIRTHPATGLTAAEVEALRDWVRGI
jgi:hypothetical protein